MPRSLPTLLALTLVGALLGSPSEATAQVRVSLQWNGIHSGGPYVYAEFGTRGSYVVGAFGHPSTRYRSVRPRTSVYVRRGVRIPPGHLPGPGQCRVWHSNRPPGHQPPPFRCSDRYHDPYSSGYGYGSSYGDGVQVYPRPEHGPRGGYYDEPPYDDRRYDEPRYDDPGNFGPVQNSPAYLEDPRGSGSYGVNAGPAASPAVSTARITANSDTAQRWSALQQIAMERRRELQQRRAGAGR